MEPATGLGVAFVTGASGGIGDEIARVLARAGYQVALAARRVAACAALAREIMEAGGRAFAVELDVAEPGSIAMAAVAARELGEIEVLVNNAGIAESAPLLSKRDARADEHEALYARHFAVNFDGPRRLAEALLPEMIARGEGVIVNVASSAGLRGYPFVAAYCASKHALLGWTRAAARELQPSGVRVHAVCPHYVDSAMTAATIANIVAKTGREPAAVRAWLARQNPGGRLVSTAEVAAAVLELVRSGGTGRLLELDGGGVRQVEGVELPQDEASGDER